MTATLTQPVSVSAPTLFRFTIEQYHSMIEKGIIEEGSPFELLDGLVMTKNRAKAGDDIMTIGHAHGYVVRVLGMLAAEIASRGFLIQIQQAVSLPPSHEPEPDAAIVRGKPQDYRSRNPGPSDITSVIEVADSSLNHDRTTKLSIYANAGIAQYVIVNLVDKVVEVHTSPVAGQGRYAQTQTLARGDELHLCVGDAPTVVVKVAEILP